MHILGIETTCDETSCAVVVDGKAILSNVIYTQAAMHAQFGGVFPELASRSHIDTITAVLDQALKEADCTLDDIDAIAVAKGPGLIGALLVGITFAKSLAWARTLPLIGINHVEAHLYAAMMEYSGQIEFPALGMVLSGSHTSIVKIYGIGKYECIAETVDDAIGEAFDKTAKILGLGYPGGPLIESLAKTGDPSRFSFKPGRIKERPLDFSFSGIKTSVLYTVKKLPQLTAQDRADIAASFQQAVFQDVLHKLEKAYADAHCNALFLGGGVTQNSALRTLLHEKLSIPCCFPRKDLCLDNAAMIAGLAYHYEPDAQDVEPETKIPFSRNT